MFPQSYPLTHQDSNMNFSIDLDTPHECLGVNKSTNVPPCMEDGDKSKNNKK